MYLYFEEYHYPKDIVLKEVCNQVVHAEVENKSKIKLLSVGYYFSSRKHDSVFILPKVFITDNLAFGKYQPEKITRITTENNPLHEEGHDKFIFGLSVWIYQAIRHFKKRNSDSSIIENAQIQSPLSTNGENSATFLDIILELREFHKKHRYLFTYISIINNSGNNKINWAKTINKNQPIFQGDTPCYVAFKNKNKVINTDEELIVLFYSVLNYLQQQYRFEMKSDVRYKQIPPSKIESMLKFGQGTRLLRKIRRKYYTDTLVRLWKLLFTFFEKAEQIECHKYREEMLLAHNFNLIFEDMIDQLIGSELGSLPRELKNQTDGKIVDHIYKDRSLIDEGDIYFVGDSKYYKSDSKLGSPSIYKQFTYAKNIIQYNIDLRYGYRKHRSEDFKALPYRDDLTEGYRITPNFFIRGIIHPDRLTHTEDLLESSKDIITNKHFDNRLFDRDTLILKEYNINFLYVLSAYVMATDSFFEKEHLRNLFRNDLIATLNSKYDFYFVKPDSDIKTYVDHHFREFIGKMYHWDGQKLLLAFEKDETTSHSEGRKEDSEWKAWKVGTPTE